MEEEAVAVLTPFGMSTRTTIRGGTLKKEAFVDAVGAFIKS